MRRILALLIALFAFSVHTQAQPSPDVISFQGRLTTPNGQAVSDGSYQLQFRLYDQPAGGTLQWSEAQIVATRGGVFTALLGSVTPLAGLTFEDGYYVGLAVNGGAELGPRTALAAVPYAFQAQRLDASALEAGSNVSITRQNDGALRIESSGGSSGSGLTRVTTDSTFDGDGTTGSPLSLADGSVTGAKLSGSALRAGANTTITRQGDGSLEIEAIGGGLSLPFASSASSSGPVLRIDNTGSGAGILVGSAGLDGIAVGSVSQSGLSVSQADDDGVFINSAGRYGLNVVNAARGVDISNAMDEGVLVRSAGRHGLLVQSAGNDGVHIDQATTDGVFVNSVGGYGLNVLNAARGVDISTTTSDGIVVRTAGRHGFLIQNAGSKGVQIDQAGNNGIQIDQAGLNGLQIGTTTFDGIQIQSPGRDGIRVSGAGGLAGNFGGDVAVDGTLTKGGGSFKIDHPLDPANKYLSHSFVESPDMMNVYNGNVMLDARGEALIDLPDYFEVLNRDFRYQLTTIGGFAPVYIAEKISGNQFRIAGGKSGMEVSWQVTGIRQDAWAEQHRIPVEEAKSTVERGYYLHPEVYGLSRERGVRSRTLEQYPEGNQ